MCTWQFSLARQKQTGHDGAISSRLEQTTAHGTRAQMQAPSMTSVPQQSHQEESERVLAGMSLQQVKHVELFVCSCLCDV